MPVAAWIVLAVLVALLVALVRGAASPAALLLGALVALVVSGVVTPEQAFVGFSSPATVTIAGLFVVARALRDHLGLEALLTRVLDADGPSLRPILLRLLPPVALLSGVVNNTPVVATTAPVVGDWARRHGLSAPRLLIPLSFATILGGTLTTIGTSTNLVVSGALEATGRDAFGFLTVTAIGAPVALVGLVLLVVLAPRLVRAGDAEPAATCAPSPAPGPDPIGSEPTGSQPTVLRPTSGGASTASLPVPLTSLPGGALAEPEPAAPASTSYRVLTIATTVAMVAVAAAGVLPMVTAVLLAAALLVGTGAIGFRRAVESLHLDVLLMVASAIGLGVAVSSSGLAATLGHGIATIASSYGATVGLLLVVLGTLLLTELITNVAAAALAVPIAIDVAERAGSDPRGFAVAVAITASASFLTPIGYQTNTIVYGVAGARFGDFWRLGLPLAVTTVAVTVLTVPLVWSGL